MACRKNVATTISSAKMRLTSQLDASAPVGDDDAGN
jgi:hypothetical protein